MNIKHLVISGGGPSIFVSLGILDRLFKENIINISNIESMYGTSSGAALALMLSLNYDTDTLYDYLIKRPWNSVFKIKPENFMSLINNKGIFENELVKQIFLPLFNAKSIPIDITMKCYHELSKIDLHFFGFDINKFKVVDISYESYPELPILDAILMSCAVPLIISPLFYKDMCVIDGGIHTNYPLKQCIEKYKDTDSILGLRRGNPEIENINETSNLIDFILNIIRKLVMSYNQDNTSPEIINEITYSNGSMSMDSIMDSINNQTDREKLYNMGVEKANEYLAKIIEEKKEKK